MIHAGRAPFESLSMRFELQYVFVVLDNCEHLIGDCAKVADAVLQRAQQSI